MDPGYAIAASALNANQTEIAVTSQNIANAQTPGYASETAQLSPLPGGGLEGPGGGVEVSAISSAQNTMLAANNWQAQGALANLTTLQQVVTGIEDVFPIGQSATSSSSTSSTSNSGIAGQLASFWNAWEAVAQDPSGQAARTQVVDLAQGLATSLQEASTQLGQIASNGVTQLQDQVTQLNTLLGQAASLNSSIEQTVGAGGNPSAIEDQLNNVLGQLAQIGGVGIITRANGPASISLGGVALVQGGSYSTASVQDNGGTYSLVAQPGSVPLSVSSGSIAGLLAGLNSYVPTYQGQLDAVANSLITAVNTQLAAGFTATGASGGPLFSGSSAATIGVVAAVAADPSLIAASGTTGAAAANDGNNAQTMAEMATSQSGPDARFQGLIQSIGSVSENLNTQVSAQQAVANQAHSALASATGVNLDAELTNLMNFQANYQASAKLLSVIDATVQALLQAV